MTQYRLIPAITVPTILRPLAVTVQYGNRDVVKHDGFIRLEPGKLYETADEVLLNSLRNYTFSSRFNQTLENELKANDVPYEIERCRSCGGKIKKIKYHPVEVIENV